MSKKKSKQPSYDDQLKDERWQRRRDEIIEQGPPGCWSCGDEVDGINVHHRYYQSGRLAWEYEDESLVPLCPRCHARADQLRRRIVRATGMLDDSDAERAIGYMEALAAAAIGPVGWIFVGSYEHAEGIGDVFALTVDEVIEESIKSKRRNRVAAARLFELSRKPGHVRARARWRNGAR